MNKSTYYILILVFLSGCAGQINTSVKMNVGTIQQDAPLTLPENYDTFAKKLVSKPQKTAVYFAKLESLKNATESNIQLTSQYMNNINLDTDKSKTYKIKEILSLYKTLNIENDKNTQHSYLTAYKDDLEYYSHILGLELIYNCENKIDETFSSEYKGLILCTSTINYIFLDNVKRKVVDKGFVTGLSTRKFTLTKDSLNNLVIMDGGGIIKTGTIINENFNKYQPSIMLDEADCNATYHLLNKLSKRLPANFFVDSFINNSITFKSKNDNTIEPNIPSSNDNRFDLEIFPDQLFMLYNSTNEFPRPIAVAKVIEILPSIAKLKIIKWSENPFIKTDVNSIKNGNTDNIRAVSMGFPESLIQATNKCSN